MIVIDLNAVIQAEVEKEVSEKTLAGYVASSNAEQILKDIGDEELYKNFSVSDPFRVYFVRRCYYGISDWRRMHRLRCL